MTALRFTLAAAALGITLAACGTEGPTAPAARTPGHRATTETDSTRSAPTGNPPAPLNTEPIPPSPPGERTPIFGSGA